MRSSASGLKADEVAEVVDDLDGDASVVDELTDTVVVSATDGRPATLAALESLLRDYEVDPERWERRS